MLSAVCLVLLQHHSTFFISIDCRLIEGFSDLFQASLEKESTVYSYHLP